MGFVNPGIGSAANQAGQMVGSGVGGLVKGLGAMNNFQATPPPIEKQDLINQINQVNPQVNDVYSQQQALARALLAQSQGVGPNPAQIALQQATNRNIQQGAGMIASQKGINPALASRIVAQNTAGANQEAAGQGALMQAQQQLAAQQQLGNVLGQTREQSLQNLGVLQNAQAAQNNAITQGSLGAQDINARVAAGNTALYGQVLGGLMNAGGGLAGMALMASEGGVIPGQAKLDGDHKENDTIPAMLSPGEIVIPRSHAKSSDLAKEFIDHLMAHKKGTDGKGYGKILEAHRKLETRISALEKHLAKGGRA